MQSALVNTNLMYLHLVINASDIMDLILSFFSFLLWMPSFIFALKYTLGKAEYGFLFVSAGKGRKILTKC